MFEPTWWKVELVCGHSTWRNDKPAVDDRIFCQTCNARGHGSYSSLKSPPQRVIL